MAGVQAALKAADLPPLAWYDVLYELYKAGAGGMRQFELCEKVLITKYNLSRLVRKLEQESLLTVVPCDEDGRGHRIEIRQQGVALLKKMWPVYGDVLQSRLGGRLSERELDTLMKLLRKLTGTSDL